MCPYAFYDKKEVIKPKLYCKINNKVCVYSKFCIKANKHIPSDGMENCFMALQEQKKNLPNGAYYVRFIRKGYLYVELEPNKVIKIKNTLNDVTDYVYLKQTNNGYEISLVPFENKTQNKTRKKKSNV